MNIPCPHCHTVIPLDTALEDKCGRAMMKYVCEWGHMASPMMNYLLLFKPRKQSLRWSRALSLAESTLALCDDRAALSLALVETVEAMRERRQRDGWKPLTSHRYLTRVIESVLARDAVKIEQPVADSQTAPLRQSKTAKSIEMLKRYSTPEGVPEWFTRAVCDAHIDLLLMGLDGTPASDVMKMAVKRAITYLWPLRNWQDGSRNCSPRKLRQSFTNEADKSKRWPTLKSVLAHIPRDDHAVWGGK